MSQSLSLSDFLSKHVKIYHGTWSHNSYIALLNKLLGNVFLSDRQNVLLKKSTIFTHTFLSFISLLFSFLLEFFICQQLKNFYFLHSSPQWARASSFTRFLDHIQRRNTVGRTPLDEWSARHRDLYLTTHNTVNRQTYTPPVGSEPTILAGERP